MKNIEKNLCSAAENLIKFGTYEEITSKIDSQKTERKMIMSYNEVKKTKKKGLKYIGLAVAACLLLVVGAFGGNYYSQNFAVDSVVNVDVNPSIELTANKSDKVLEVNAINVEAKKVVKNLDLKGIDLDTAVSAIIGSCLQNGYLKEGAENEILISVKNDDKAHAKALEKNINAQIATKLNNKKAKATVINQQIVEDDKALELAQKNNISLGRASFILSLVEKDSSLKPEELAKLSIHELAEIISQNKIDISDFAEYEYDENLLENVEEIIEEKNEDIVENTAKPQQTQKPEKPQKSEKTESEEIVASAPESEVNVSSEAKPSKNISPQDAVNIALKHAGVKKKDAVVAKTELDYDDGINKFEIEFKANNYEYNYEIDAVSGAVLDYDKEYDDDVVVEKPVQKPETKPQKNSVTKAKAEEIAIAHAKNLGASDNVKLVEIEKDDGKYEIELKDGLVEYSYEISAKTGEIIEYETEIDD